MADSKRDYYEVLGVDRNADEETLKKAIYDLRQKILYVQGQLSILKGYSTL